MVGGVMIHINHLLHTNIVDKDAQVHVYVLRDQGRERLRRIAEHVGYLLQPQIPVRLRVVHLAQQINDIVAGA